MKLIWILFISFLACGLVRSEMDDEAPGEANSNNGGPQPEDYMGVTIVEGPNTTDVGKRGIQGNPRCRWSHQQLHNVGSILRCGCLRCLCENSNWMCDYHFKYCPYYYCGNKIFNPITHTCCCGEIHAKKSKWACCGYKYYNTGLQKCCSYSSIKNKGGHCPRDTV